MVFKKLLIEILIFCFWLFRVRPKKVQWYHKKQRITSKRNRVMITPRGVLRILKVRPGDIGYYRCSNGHAQYKTLFLSIKSK